MSDPSKPQQVNTKQSTANPSKANMSTSDASGPATSSNSVDESAFMQQLAGEFLQTISTPKLLAPALQKAKLAQIEALVSARDKTDKIRLKYALIHVGVVYGTGPNIDYKTVPLAPGGGCRTVMMSQVVDGIVGRDQYRKFMNVYGDEAHAYVRANPAIRETLAERATRNGIPVTNLEAVIDFGKPSLDNPENLGYRAIAKTAAVNRANTVEDNSMFRKTKNSVADSQRIDNNSMNNSATKNVDRYGPV